MTALAMILAAGMAVGSGPEKVSGEVEQGLDLRGEWEGTSPCPPKSDCVVRFVKNKLNIYDPSTKCSIGFTVIDEGGGRLRLPLTRVRGLLGIYRYQDHDHLHICFSANETGHRPTSFHVGNDRMYLILHRVKPAK
jgi:hypothetical protein